MPKPTPESDAAARAGSDEAITLVEYCLLRSKTDKRVELIAAFNHTEQAAGVVKDTEAAFAARFTEFANKPV